MTSFYAKTFHTWVNCSLLYITILFESLHLLISYKQLYIMSHPYWWINLSMIYFNWIKLTLMAKIKYFTQNKENLVMKVDNFFEGRQ